MDVRARGICRGLTWSLASFLASLLRAGVIREAMQGGPALRVLSGCPGGGGLLRPLASLPSMSSVALGRH